MRIGASIAGKRTGYWSHRHSCDRQRLHAAAVAEPDRSRRSQYRIHCLEYSNGSCHILSWLRDVLEPSCAGGVRRRLSRFVGCVAVVRASVSRLGPRERYRL
jgi:hypothetical protein